MDGTTRAMQPQRSERELAIAEVRAHLETALRGSGEGVVVVGEPGIGKSKLLREVALTDTAIVRVSGREAEQHLPFGALVDALTSISKRLGTDGLSGRALQIIESVVLQSGFNVAPLVIYRTALGALLAASETEPVILVIDDAHWLDQTSLEAFVYVMRRIRDEPIAMLFATRPNSVPLGLGLPMVELNGLAPNVCADLVRGTRVVQLHDDVVLQLHRRTRGNPLAFGQIAQHLNDDQWLGNQAIPDFVTVGAAVEEAFASDLRDLANDARVALGVLGLVGAAHETGVVHVLGELGLDRSIFDRRDLEPFLDVTARSVEFHHPIVRLVALSLLSDPQRRAIHQACLGYFDGVDAARAAWHRVESVPGSDDEGAMATIAAAEAARSRGARSVAAELFQRAAELASDVDTQEQWQLAAGACLFEASRLTEARRVLERLMLTTNDPARRADAAMMLGSLMTFGESTTMAIDLLITEALRVKPRDERRAAMLFANAFTAATSALRFSKARDIAREVALLQSSDPVASIVAQTIKGGMAIVDGDPIALELLHPVRQLAGAMSSTGMLEADHLVQAVALADMVTERWDEALVPMEALIQRARLGGTEGVTIMAYSIACEVGLRTGQWANAYSWSRLAEQTYVEPEDRTFAQMTTFALQARVEAHLGLEADVMEHCDFVFEAAQRTNNQAHMCWARHACGLIALSKGEYEEASLQLGIIAQLERESGTRESGHLWWAGDFIEAMVGLGQRGTARSHVERLREEGARTGRQYALGIVARGEALLGDDDTAEREFARSFKIFDALGAPFEAARSQLLLAESRSRRDADYMHLRGQALTVFERLGSRLWSARARSIGVSPADEDPTDRKAFDALTPRELEAALLAARGRTNREIADELFLSPKTVEHQLSRVYRKLEIRRRSELARVLHSR